jgi:3,4-dihydroxy 2-butanone 4-phosphate synthase/GTP cyclohydrolase II
MNTIEEALYDLVSGKIIIVMDDEERENEGDLIASSELCTPDIVNFMSTHAKGLICVAIENNRAKELELSEMVQSSSALHSTKFTVSVDYVHGTSTGISAMDRAATIRALANNDTKPSDLARPGHIFPLISVEGGVLRRPGHTEATTDLMKLAGLKPSGVLCEIINEDGTMARLDDIKVFASKHNLKIITVKDLIAHRLEKDSLVVRTSKTEIDSIYGRFDLYTYKNTIDDKEHIALVKGEWTDEEAILVRAHSEDLTAKIFRTLKNEDESQLRKALKMIDTKGKGVLLYINHSMYNSSLSDRIQALSKQENILNTKAFYETLGIQPDPKDFGIGAQILADLGVKKMEIITNSPKKRIGLKSFGIEIVGTVPFN